MGNMSEYERLMQEQRRLTSARFPMLPPELQPSDDESLAPLGFDEFTDAQKQRLSEEAALSENMQDRGRLERLQAQGEMMGYSPELITQTLGDIMYTGAAGARHMMGEEGAKEEALTGVGLMALPFSPLMIRSMSRSLQKAAKSMTGSSADSLRRNLGTIDQHVSDRLGAIDFDLKGGKITDAEALIRRGQVEGRAQNAITKAERLFTDSRRGVPSDLTRRLDHEAMNKARVARGEAPIPYKEAQAYGTGGLKEDSLTQPFQGGETIVTGRKGARSPTVEDELREARQILDPSNTRLPTAAEKQQLDELGEIVTRDPKAPNTAIVDDSGNVLVGKPGTKAAKDAPDPYPEGTGDIISRMPIEKEYARGLGRGTVGMSDSLVRSLSEIAKKEFPTHFDERRLVVDPSKYFDALTPAQQKQVLDKAKVQPGLSRDIARFEQVAKEASQRPVLSTREPSKKVREATADRMVTRRRKASADAMTRSDAQASLKGKRRATGTTDQLKKRVVREGSQEGLPQKQFLTELKDMRSRFSPDEMKFIEQQVKRGKMPATAQSLDQFEKMKAGLKVVYDKQSREYIVVQSKTSRKPTGLRSKTEPPPPPPKAKPLPTLGKSKAGRSKADEASRKRGLARKKRRSVEVKSDKK